MSKKKKVRRQYFTGCMNLLWGSYFWVVFITFAIQLKAQSVSFADYLDAIGGGFLGICGIQLVLGITHLINVFCFGRVICVVNEKGIYYGKRFVPWESIQEMEYHIGIIRRYDVHNYCHLNIKTKHGKISFQYAPLRLIRLAKGYNRNIRCRLDSGSKKLIAGYFFVAIVLSVVMFFMI